jgi:hypothetical protein
VNITPSEAVCIAAIGVVAVALPPGGRSSATPARTAIAAHAADLGAHGTPSTRMWSGRLRPTASREFTQAAP